MLKQLEKFIQKQQKNNVHDSFYCLEVFANDPTELNLIIFLKTYCHEFDIDFISEFNSAFNYNNAMSMVFELKTLGFNYHQFKMIKRNKKSKKNHYSDLLMITDVSREQLDILKNKEEIYEILFPESDNNTCFISI